jgi:hypothetical protein
VEEDFFGGGRQVTVIDGALRAPALDALLAFCREATVWHETRPNGPSCVGSCKGDVLPLCDGSARDGSPIRDLCCT